MPKPAEDEAEPAGGNEGTPDPRVAVPVEAFGVLVEGVSGATALGLPNEVAEDGQVGGV